MNLIQYQTLSISGLLIVRTIEPGMIRSSSITLVVGIPSTDSSFTCNYIIKIKKASKLSVPRRLTKNIILRNDISPNVTVPEKCFPSSFRKWEHTPEIVYFALFVDVTFQKCCLWRGIVVPEFLCNISEATLRKKYV